MFANVDCEKVASCRGSSIKTRIETEKTGLRTVDLISGCRGSSIKTRIETHFQEYSCGFPRHVAEVVPLKQGLKRHFLPVFVVSTTLLQR